ncbi:MAG: type II secretion system minor pseudopilin GspI [Woeseiaceae bacterium]|nr:type II secretion system minor pseudopilin GspI [Woeseiaceae bacterium]
MRQRRPAGFTLIEVLVALAVISLALLTIGGEMGAMVDTANTMQERTYASWIAQNKITELRLANVIPEVSSTSGEVDYAGTEWRWRAVVSETGVENLYRVDVSVGYPGTEGDVRTVTGFIGEPTVPGQANRAWQRGPEGSGERR